MQDVAGNVPASDERIRKAAEDTLREWPEATAAVLFGSRARGDHRSDSDWDIAIMTRTAEDLPRNIALRQLDGDYEIQLVAMPAGRMDRKCNSPGHVAFIIARQGRLLAGSWKSPPLKENAPMQDEEFMRWYGNAAGHVQTVAYNLVYASRLGWFYHAEQFVAASSQAAEHLVKGMICRHRGVLPDKTHNVESLARMSPEPLRRKAAELNGMTGKHHLADYIGINPEDCRIAGRRTVLTIDLLAGELVGARRDDILAAEAKSLAQLLQEITRSWAGPLRESVDKPLLSNMDGRGRDVVAAALEQRDRLANALEAAIVALDIC